MHVKLIEKITDIREEISTLVAKASEEISTEQEQKAMMWLNKAIEISKNDVYSFKRKIQKHNKKLFNN